MEGLARVTAERVEAALQLSGPDNKLDLHRGRVDAALMERALRVVQQFVVVARLGAHDEVDRANDALLVQLPHVEVVDLRGRVGRVCLEDDV